MKKRDRELLKEVFKPKLPAPNLESSCVYPAAKAPPPVYDMKREGDWDGNWSEDGIWIRELTDPK